jgi:hypothetical protein
MSSFKNSRIRLPLSVPIDWIDRNILALGREMRLSYLPPLMIYVAAGISGLTGIVGTFFVKDYLGLSAEFLASLGFWIMLPWGLKLPLGHVVDLIWRYKTNLVYLGAFLITLSLLIMLGLLTQRTVMESLLSAEVWYVLSALLAPLGYVVQDVVADAMTVEAVPRTDDHGHPLSEQQRRLMNATMQTLGRVAIISGTLLVAGVNVLLFQGAESFPEVEKIAIYRQIYLLALLIPLISVAGVLMAAWLKQRRIQRWSEQGFTRSEIEAFIAVQEEPPKPNGWILWGGLAFGLISLSVGLINMQYGQELIFILSLSIILILMSRIMNEMDRHSREVLLGTAVIIFAFRAVPSSGPGSTWWMIDVLKFDQSFMAQLSLVASSVTLAALFIFRRYMAEQPITSIIVALTLLSTLLALPIVGMYYGLHEWTAAHTYGWVDARFIALMDTALESPLGQIAMVPMLAWIAQSAPSHLKATFFALMASFTNLSLALGQLGTKYLNQIFIVTREVKDPISGNINVTADYSELGGLLLTAILIGLLLPLGAIGVARKLCWKSV